MRILLTAALGAVASCSPGGLKYQELQEWRGASTRLRLVEVEPELGRPLRLTLELHNGGPTPFLYDDQGIGLGTFEVSGPDGKDVPYIGWWASTFGTEKELPPGATAVLLDAHDISTDYLFEVPGRYRVRFGGGGLYFNKPGEDWPGFHPILLISDWVEFTIGEGKPAPVADVVRRLRPILPEGWRIATGSFEGAMTVRLIRGTGEKGDEIWLQLGGAPGKSFTRIGESPWGLVWVKNQDVIEVELRPALLQALARP